jgi:hypothetical protein
MTNPLMGGDFITSRTGVSPVKGVFSGETPYVSKKHKGQGKYLCEGFALGDDEAI